jgi:predicted  nucleic acid-binding Zn-ribbon protein
MASAIENYVEALEHQVESLRAAMLEWKEAALSLQAQVREFERGESETRARRIDRLVQETLARKG